MSRTLLFRPLLACAALTMPLASIDAQSSGRAGCLDSVPAAVLEGGAVYAAAELADADPVSPNAVASMDLLTQAVAEQARTLLGAGAGQLPPGEPAITWRHLEHQLRVV